MWLIGKKKDEPDEDLARHFRESGDMRVMGTLFEKHVKTVFGVCLFYFRSRAKAEDEVMRIFEKLMVELRKNEVRNFRPWLSFVVRNHCISELRKNNRERLLPEEYLDFEVRDADLQEEEEVYRVDDETMIRFLEETINELKPKQRECVELFYLKKMSYDEISKSTNYSVAEVKSYLQNGKRNLKIRISEKMKNENRTT